MRKLHTCVQGECGRRKRWHIPPTYMWWVFEESLGKGILREVWEYLKETTKGWVKLLGSSISREWLPHVRLKRKGGGAAAG